MTIRSVALAAMPYVEFAGVVDAPEERLIGTLASVARRRVRNSRGGLPREALGAQGKLEDNAASAANDVPVRPCENALSSERIICDVAMELERRRGRQSAMPTNGVAVALSPFVPTLVDGVTAALRELLGIPAHLSFAWHEKRVKPWRLEVTVGHLALQLHDPGSNPPCSWASGLRSRSAALWIRPRCER